MHEFLFSYIEAKSGEKLTVDERANIQAAFERKRMRKRQYLLQEGDVCKYIGFIAKGSARMFSVDGKGQEHVLRFGLEGWWMTDHDSLYNRTPSIYNIETLEDSELLVCTNANANELKAKSRCFDLTLKVLDKFQSIAQQKRIYATIGMSAEERFRHLADVYPEFLLRFPMGMIASYLGLSPETLSRIRRKACLSGAEGGLRGARTSSDLKRILPLTAP